VAGRHILGCRGRKSLEGGPADMGRQIGVEHFFIDESRYGALPLDPQPVGTL
jgi:hypothetical protein